MYTVPPLPLHSGKHPKRYVSHPHTQQASSYLCTWHRFLACSVHVCLLYWLMFDGKCKWVDLLPFGLLARLLPFWLGGDDRSIVCESTVCFAGATPMYTRPYSVCAYYSCTLVFLFRHTYGTYSLKKNR